MHSHGRQSPPISSEAGFRVASMGTKSARLVWVIAPQAKTATIYRADGSARLLREQDHLEGEDVLPGLAIPLAEVFA